MPTAEFVSYNNQRHLEIELGVLEISDFTVNKSAQQQMVSSKMWIVKLEGF